MTWLEYVKEFWILIPIVVLIAPALFLAGSKALAQSKSIDIFILVQGTVIGHLFAQSIGLEGSADILSCYVFAALAWYLSDRILGLAGVYQSAARIALYAFLLVGVFVFERWVPGLERHVNSAFVGDLLYLSTTKALLLIFIGLCFLIFYSSNFHELYENIFYKNILKIQRTLPKASHVLNFLLLVSATHFLGLSFTLGFSVVLPLLLSLAMHSDTLKKYTTNGSLFCSVAGALSLLLSFRFPDQSTTPLVVLYSSTLAVAWVLRSRYAQS